MPKAHKNQGRIFGILRGWGGVNLFSGANLEGVWGVCDTPPKYKSSGLAGQIIWIGRAMKDFK
jgi:hypothetical protein